MREIKFRGQDINGDWHIGNLNVITTGRIDIEKGSYISNSVGSPFAFQVRPETVGQLSGVEDAEDNKLFDGDIIEFSYEASRIRAPMQRLTTVSDNYIQRALLDASASYKRGEEGKDFCEHDPDAELVEVDVFPQTAEQEEIHEN